MQHRHQHFPHARKTIANVNQSSPWLFPSLLFIFRLRLHFLLLIVLFHTRINDAETTFDSRRTTNTLADTFLTDDVRYIFLLRLQQTSFLVDPISTQQDNKTVHVNTKYSPIKTDNKSTRGGQTSATANSVQVQTLDPDDFQKLAGTS